MTTPHRLRLKLPNGAELEAEGEAEFVRREREEFLLRQPPAPSHAPLAPAQTAAREPRVDWAAVAEAKNGGLLLRGKIPDADKTGRDAALVLLIASEQMLGQSKPTAAALAKWLRTAGYPVGRMDRVLQDAVAGGELLSSGSRRSRRYELTAAGKIRALLLAERLTATVRG